MSIVRLYRDVALGKLTPEEAAEQLCRIQFERRYGLSVEAMQRVYNRTLFLRVILSLNFLLWLCLFLHTGRTDSLMTAFSAMALIFCFDWAARHAEQRVERLTQLASGER